MVVILVQIAAALGVPLLILRRRNKGLTKLFGTVAASYFWGILTSVGVWLANLCGAGLNLSADVGEIGSYACIALAIPLLMFGTDLRAVRRLTKMVLLSFASLIVSVLAVAFAVGRTLAVRWPWGRALCAMAVGMYTGGTPNFNAVGVIVGADSDIIAVGNLSDMLVGTAFYIFVLLAAKPLLAHLLDRRARGVYMHGGDAAENMDVLEWRGALRPLGRNLLLALACAAAGGVVGLLLWRARGGAMTDWLVPAVMISGTVLGLALSFVRPVREVKENALAGHYLIMVFSFALAASLDLREIHAALLPVMGLLATITFASFALHVLLSRLLRIEADCTIVTLTAGIYGPAFIPAVTRQLRNDALTAPGLICGAIGYAVGTLLGSALYLLL